MANLFAIRARASTPVPVTVYSYGSPRLGNSAFATFVDAKTASSSSSEYRITHIDDPVPRVPPLLLGYRHTGPELWLRTRSVAGTLDYGPADVVVCEGQANMSCNAGTVGFDVDAHLNYFTDLSACQGPMTWRRDGDGAGADYSDDEMLIETLKHCTL